MIEGNNCVRMTLFRTVMQMSSLAIQICFLQTFSFPSSQLEKLPIMAVYKKRKRKKERVELMED